MKRLSTVALALALGIGAAYAQTVLGPATTSVTTSVTGTMNALAANPSRKALTVCNNDATNKVTITTGTLSPVSLTVGLVLLNGNVATSCQTFGSPANTGSSSVGAQINVIGAAGTPTVTFIEYY